VTLSYETAHELALLSGVVLTATDVRSALDRVTETAQRVSDGCDGVSVTMREHGQPTASAASNDWARGLDALQVEQQEGPCLDCMREGSVMRTPDLAEDGRFPNYGPRAAGRGAQSTLSVPLTGDGRTVGALNFYSRTPDAFGTDQVALAVLLAAHATLALQAANAYFSSRDLAGQLQDAMSSRAVIEQAKGVLMGRRGCDADEAFRILVDLSQRSNRKLREVAAALLAETAAV
jgi:GAF domain-containing protein